MKNEIESGKDKNERQRESGKEMGEMTDRKISKKGGAERGK